MRIKGKATQEPLLLGCCDGGNFLLMEESERWFSSQTHFPPPVLSSFSSISFIFHNTFSFIKCILYLKRISSARFPRIKLIWFAPSVGNNNRNSSNIFASIMILFVKWREGVLQHSAFHQCWGWWVRVSSLWNIAVSLSTSTRILVYYVLSCTLIESHVLIGCLLLGMNSYSFFEMQKKSYPLSGDDVYLISPLGQRCASHIPSRAIRCIPYPLLGNQAYLIFPLRQSSVSHIPV